MLLGVVWLGERFRKRRIGFGSEFCVCRFYCVWVGICCFNCGFERGCLDRGFERGCIDSSFECSGVDGGLKRCLAGFVCRKPGIGLVCSQHGCVHEGVSYRAGLPGVRGHGARVRWRRAH